MPDLFASESAQAVEQRMARGGGGGKKDRARGRQEGTGPSCCNDPPLLAEASPEAPPPDRTIAWCISGRAGGLGALGVRAVGRVARGAARAARARAHLTAGCACAFVCTPGPRPPQGVEDATEPSPPARPARDASTAGLRCLFAARPPSRAVRPRRGVRRPLVSTGNRKSGRMRDSCGLSLMIERTKQLSDV